MTPTYERQLRIAILQQLRDASRLGLSVAELQIGAEGFSQVTKTQIEGELHVLSASCNGLVESVDEELSPEVKSYRLTPAGGDWLSKNL